MPNRIYQCQRAGFNQCNDSAAVASFIKGAHIHLMISEDFSCPYIQQLQLFCAILGLKLTVSQTMDGDWSFGPFLSRRLLSFSPLSRLFVHSSGICFAPFLLEGPPAMPTARASKAWRLGMSPPVITSQHRESCQATTAKRELF